MPVLYPTVVLC